MRLFLGISLALPHIFHLSISARYLQVHSLIICHSFSCKEFSCIRDRLLAIVHTDSHPAGRAKVPAILANYAGCGIIELVTHTAKQARPYRSSLFSYFIMRHDVQLLLNQQQQIWGGVYIHWHFIEQLRNGNLACRNCAFYLPFTLTPSLNLTHTIIIWATISVAKFWKSGWQFLNFAKFCGWPWQILLISWLTVVSCF